MNSSVIVIMLIVFAVWSLVMMVASGRFTFLDKPIKINRRGKLILASEKKAYKPYIPRRFEKTTFLLFALCMSRIANHVGNYLFLCILYGVSRVNSEGLHFTNMPSGHTWIVSNGDQVAANLDKLPFVISAVTWLIITLPTFILIRKVLPKQRQTTINNGVPAVDKESLTENKYERRSLVEKGRQFLAHRLLFVACWVIAMVLLFVFAQVIGRMVFVLIPGISIILYIIYVRSHTRHFVSMMITTPCTQCGQVPMRYEPPRNENGNNHLLICDKCGIEWDLGPM